MLAGIETGGTKVVVAVGTAPDDILAIEHFPTGTDPAATLAPVSDFITTASSAHGALRAVGVGSFGPCDPDPASPTYGHVTASPKPGWRFVDVVGILREQLARRGLPGDIPVGFDTDVNAAALAEATYGAARGLRSAVYVTVGTGIGGGAWIDGRLVHGLMHPEMGHVRIPRPEAERAVFPGICPYHGDCWEGVASGPALAARWGRPAEALPADHPAWDLEADYLAAGFHALVCTLSPERIVIGGGVGLFDGLLERVRPRLVASLGGYIDQPAMVAGIDSFLVPTALHGEAGVVGALELAAAARDTRP